MGKQRAMPSREPLGVFLSPINGKVQALTFTFACGLPRFERDWRVRKMGCENTSKLNQVEVVTCLWLRPEEDQRVDLLEKQQRKKAARRKPYQQVEALRLQRLQLHQARRRCMQEKRRQQRWPQEQQRVDLLEKHQQKKATRVQNKHIPH